MTWTGTAQAALDAGQAVEWNALVHVKAKSSADGSDECVGRWTGAEPLSLTVEGEARTYQPAGGALVAGDRDVSEGLTIPSNSVSLEGVNALVNALRRDFDISQAPADAHVLLMTVGQAVLGTKRLFRGNVDGDSFQLNEAEGALSLDVVSLLRRGTRRYARMRDDGRDPMFKYAHIGLGDSWG